MNWLHSALALAWAATAHAQIVTDGTMGAAGALTGPDFAIPDTLGQTRGNNLFHSFSQLNVAAGESATFTGPVQIQNVLARVTGGHASTIDGALTCDIAGANFFFINPFGVIFGPNARVNVSGSLVVTTADHVKLADGGRFDARTPANDVLTTAPVSAFGFLGPTGAITVQGAGGNPVPPDWATLPDGASLALIAGDITLGDFTTRLPGGRVLLVSVQSAGELTLDATDPTAPVDLTHFDQLGDVTLHAAADFNLNGSRGGGWEIHAHNITLESFTARSQGSEAVDGLPFRLAARGQLTASGTQLITSSDAAVGGAILINAAQVHLDGNVQFNAESTGSGRSGNLTLTATDWLRLENNSAIRSLVSGVAGGDVTVTAPQLTLLNSSYINADALVGDAGNVMITTDSLRLENESGISAVAQFGGGRGGAVTIQTGEFVIRNGSGVSVRSEGSGDAGDITVNSTSLWIEGNPEIAFTGFTAETFGESGAAGRGGNITIVTGDLTILNSAVISAISINDQPAGTITITADNLRARGPFTFIQTRSFDTGPGGDVVITAARLVELADQSFLTAAAFGSVGGNITVTAGREIRLTDSAVTALADGDGGNITLTAPLLIHLLNTEVSAASFNGTGGNVTIDPIFVVLQNSQILASAIAGNGGNIAITTQYFLSNDSLVDASSEFGLDGSVTINAPRLDLTEAIPTLLAELLDAEAQLQPHCFTRLPAHVSTFITTGRGATPNRPDELQPTLPSLR